jgi:hypothetical protein
MLVDAGTPAYRFGSGTESQDTIDSSFCPTPNLELDDDNISSSLPSSEFHTGPCSSPLTEHGFHRSTKVGNDPALAQYLTLPAAQSTRIPSSDTNHHVDSTTNYTSPTLELSSFYSEFAIESEHEMGFLLRHFSDFIAPW